VQDHQAIVEVEVTDDNAVNEAYKETLSNLRDRKPVPVTQRSDLDQAARDYYANVRTNVLLFWVLTNVSDSVLRKFKPNIYCSARDSSCL